MTLRAAGPDTATGAAHELAGLVAPLFGGPLPLRLRAWDGSVAGPDDAPDARRQRPAALRRLIFRPGELGLAQAYVTGEIDVEGDLLDGFRRVWQRPRAGRRSPRLGRRQPRWPGTADGLRPRAWSAEAARAAGDAGAAARTAALATPRPGRHRPPLRPVERLLRPHPRPAHGLLLRVLHEDDPSYTLEDAQRDKLDLVCRKLGLDALARASAHRHLDIGCGWGSLSITRRKEYGVSVVGVTSVGRAEGLHRRSGSRSEGLAGPRRDPAPGLPRGHRRALRHGLLDRDGRARRPAQLPDVRRRDPRGCSCRADGSSCSRCRARRSPAAGPSSRRSSRPTCTCGRWGRPSTSSSRAASRSATCTRCGSTT